VKYMHRFAVKPGSKVKLHEIDPGFKDHRYESHKDAAKEIEKDREKLRSLQELLYADGSCSVLLCLQGMDTAGKDGTIRHILATMNPQGCRVAQFRQPSAIERAHDFLWRVHKVAPARREVTIFNRSQYEDAMVAASDPSAGIRRELMRAHPPDGVDLWFLPRHGDASQAVHAPR
jgi:polyphosphate kinase 2 (PPK2 family)